jgi:hypothetical protein
MSHGDPPLYRENYRIMSYNQGGDNPACHPGALPYNHGEIAL